MKQIDWVTKQLNETGRVSRNEALGLYITRTAAYVNELRRRGWQIETRRERNDCVYYKRNRPLNAQEANQFLRSL